MSDDAFKALTGGIGAHEWRPSLDGGAGNGAGSAPRDDDLPPDAELDESWYRIDLAPALRGEVLPVVPTVLHRDDGAALLYAGRVNGLHGDSGTGKTWVALLAAAQLLRADEHVIWIDFEEPDETTVVARLRELEVTDEAIADGLHYYRPTEPFTTVAVKEVTRANRDHRAALLVIDSLGEAFGLEGVDENKDVDVSPWYRRVARPLADVGPAVLVIDHSTKAGDNPLYPSGSKRKRAAITGASYLVEATRPLTREEGGALRLTCAKDRHGHYRRGGAVASADFTVYPDGGMTVHLWPSSTQAGGGQAPSVKLDRSARAAVRSLKARGEPLSQRVLTELMEIKASAQTKRAGIEEAITRGAIRTEAGPRGAVLHVFVQDLEDPVPEGSGP
jgi:AAA domain